MTALDHSDHIVDLLAPIAVAHSDESAPSRVAPIATTAALCEIRCSKADLAAFLGITARRISQLVEDGVVKSVGRGRDAFNVADATRTYCAFLSDKARGRLGEGDPLKEQKIRQASEAADRLAMQNARDRGELVSAAAVEAEWGATLRGVRAAMLAVPARVHSRVPTLTAHDLAELDREIRDALTEIGEGRA
ncbi:hypothetical protein [Brevundimonas faecalis]|uniref:Phage terminase Nu1 subunit (DNA packaging protein) n=1 Tax=Brevundimonas faecalis TaxID=947378 RepID=A0ABV2RE69_9CAUL